MADFYGGSEYDSFVSTKSSDRFFGKGGFDRVSFSEATQGVVVRLALTGPQETNWGLDAFDSIEDIQGSSYRDNLVGNGAFNTFDSGAGADILSGAGGDDRLWAGSGNDELYGGIGNDGLIGEGGNDYMHGGSGTDGASYSYSPAPIKVDLEITSAQDTGWGLDTLFSIENVSGSWDFGDRLYGTEAANWLWGHDGNDYLNGRAGNDTLHGGDGDDRLLGGFGDDLIWGDNGRNTVSGGAGDDLLRGGIHADALLGGAGTDDLMGWDGADRLTGYAGADSLKGGANADRFIFLSASDSRPGARDSVADFQDGLDELDLREIDVRPDVPGDQAFTWRDTGGFSGARGDLYFTQTSPFTGDTIIYGDLDGDKDPDLEIVLKGLHDPDGDILL